MQEELSQDEINAILKAGANAGESAAPDTQPDAPPDAQPNPIPPTQDAGLPLGGAQEQVAQGGPGMGGGASIGQEQINTFQSTPGTPAGVAPAGASNIGFLMDIPLDVSVELGRTKIAVKDMLQLGPGSVIELDKLIGEPVDLLVNERLIAKGEVVVFDESFGIRITDIINPEDRLRSLG